MAAGSRSLWVATAWVAARQWRAWARRLRGGRRRGGGSGSARRCSPVMAMCATAAAGTATRWTTSGRWRWAARMTCGISASLALTIIRAPGRAWEIGCSRGGRRGGGARRRRPAMRTRGCGGRHGDGDGSLPVVPVGRVVVRADDVGRVVRVAGQHPASGDQAGYVAAVDDGHVAAGRELGRVADQRGAAAAGRRDRYPIAHGCHPPILRQSQTVTTRFRVSVKGGKPEQ